MIRKILVTAILAGSFGSIATPAAAQIIVRIAPPPLRVEVAPGPRVGHLWVPGYWNWRSNRHQWVAGTWVRERRGYQYVQPSWVERDGRWHMTRGNWRRGDRDGDGVPNRVDKDRDGDGVRNRADRKPDNPNRR